MHFHIALLLLNVISNGPDGRRRQKNCQSFVLCYFCFPCIKYKKLPKHCPVLFVCSLHQIQNTAKVLSCVICVLTWGFHMGLIRHGQNTAKVLSCVICISIHQIQKYAKVLCCVICVFHASNTKILPKFGRDSNTWRVL